MTGARRCVAAKQLEHRGMRPPARCPPLPWLLTSRPSSDCHLGTSPPPNPLLPPRTPLPPPPPRAAPAGQLFPDTDPKWKGASSDIFLKEAARLMGEAGYVLGNLDATIIAQKPKLSPHKVRALALPGHAWLRRCEAGHRAWLLGVPGEARRATRHRPRPRHCCCRRTSGTTCARCSTHTRR